MKLSHRWIVWCVVGPVLAACAALAFYARHAASRYPEHATLERKGAEVVASGFFLGGDDAERLLALLAAPEVRRLRIGYVPGGYTNYAARMIGLMNNKDAVVEGPCASACASGLLGARSITLAPEQHGPMPPLLAYHGLFRLKGDGTKENVVASSTRYAKLVQRRFPYLALDDLEQAMHYDADDVNGLVIQRAPAGGFDFSLCKPWPKHCRAIHHLDADRL